MDAPNATPFLRVAYIYRPQTKLREGNVFTGVCLPTKGEGGYSHPTPQVHGTWDTTGHGRQAVGTHPTGMLSIFDFG